MGLEPVWLRSGFRLGFRRPGRLPVLNIESAEKTGGHGRLECLCAPAIGVDHLVDDHVTEALESSGAELPNTHGYTAGGVIDFANDVVDEILGNRIRL